MKAKRFNYWFTQELHEQFGLIREDNRIARIEKQLKTN